MSWALALLLSLLTVTSNVSAPAPSGAPPAAASPAAGRDARAAAAASSRSPEPAVASTDRPDADTSVRVGAEPPAPLPPVSERAVETCPPGLARLAGVGCGRYGSDGLFHYDTGEGTASTHGPDHAADGHGTVVGPNDPQRAPVCAPHGSHRFVFLYASVAGGPDRLSQVAPVITRSVRINNAVLAYSGRRAASVNVDLRVACTSSGQPTIRHIRAAGTSFDEVRKAATAAGWDRPHEHYLIYVDADVKGVCGVADVHPDSRRTVDNLNNGTRNHVGVVYRSCWETHTPLHEIGHLMGAVQLDAPDSDGGWHCSSEGDVMCSLYATSAGCSELLFDCRFDSYFHPAPPAGSYLAKRWNVGWCGNRFVRVGTSRCADTEPTGGTGGTGGSGSTGGTNRPPAVAVEADCDSLTCTFTAWTSDADGDPVRVAWEFGDGNRSVGHRVVHTYDKAATYSVTATASDKHRAKATTTTTVRPCRIDLLCI